MIRINLLSRRSASLPDWAFPASLVVITLLLGTLSRAAPILGGKTVDGDEYPAIYGMKMTVRAGTGPTGGNTTLCTAFLVAPRLLITAAHCLRDTVSIDGITHEESVESGDGPVAESFLANPDYFPTPSRAPDEDEKRSGRADIGYVVLEKPVRNVVPLEVAVSDTDSGMNSLVGKTATLVGYGASVWESSGIYDGSTAGRKRAGNKAVSEVRNGLFYLIGAENGTLGGDSGGPMLIESGGTLKAAAINHKESDSTKTVLRRKVPFGKKVPQEVRAGYYASIESPLTTANLCWVEKSSGVDIAGVDCAAAAEPVK